MAMDACASAMQNPYLIGKIANAMEITSLKTCRCLNSLWYGEVTKVLKNKSVILVSRDTISKLMHNDPNSTDIFWKAVRINTSFSLGDTPLLLKFLGMHAETLEFIEWTDSAAICHYPGPEQSGDFGERQFLSKYEWNYDLPKLTELVLKPTFAFGDNLTLILRSAPNLRILRVDFIQYDTYCVNEFLAALQAQTDFGNLKTLQFGRNTCLKLANVQMIIRLLNLELKEFILEGLIPEMRDGSVFRAILERWSDTLETVVFRVVLPFKVTFVMSRLKSLTVGTFRLYGTFPINTYFPSLKYFRVRFESEFKLKQFIPPNMEPHENMRELSLIGEDLMPEEFENVVKMIEKFPNLSTLSIPTTDEYLETIYTSCPNLKSLSIRGSFTDVGVTGINNRDLDNFYKIHLSTGYIVVCEDFIEEHGIRKFKSILDLKQLRELSLSSESVGDKSVLWGILPFRKNLKKLHLPANVTDKSLTALMGFKELRELWIPSPSEGHISLETLKNFSANMIHVQLRYGTNERLETEGQPEPLDLLSEDSESDDEGFS